MNKVQETRILSVIHHHQNSSRLVKDWLLIISEEPKSLITIAEFMICCNVAVTCAWKEPVPGWTNSKNGPTGFIMGAAKGILRRLPIDKDITYDYIPVDIVINELIVAAWHVGTTRYAKFALLTHA